MAVTSTAGGTARRGRGRCTATELPPPTSIPRGQAAEVGPPRRRSNLCRRRSDGWATSPPRRSRQQPRRVRARLHPEHRRDRRRGTGSSSCPHEARADLIREASSTRACGWPSPVVWPAPTSHPRQRRGTDHSRAAERRYPHVAREKVHGLGYPLAMVHAEKIVTAVERGVANTRWKNFGDLCMLSRPYDVNETTELATGLAIGNPPLGRASSPRDDLAGYADLAAPVPGLAAHEAPRRAPRALHQRAHPGDRVRGPCSRWGSGGDHLGLRPQQGLIERVQRACSGRVIRGLRVGQPWAEDGSRADDDGPQRSRTNGQKSR